MLGSISPVGETSRRQRWWITAGVYTVASVVAGGATGLAFGGVGQALSLLWPVSQPVRLGLLAALVLVGALFDAKVIRRPLPTWHRQVDERWLTTYRGWVYGAGFGLQLGTGIVTIVPSAVTYAALGAALLSASWQSGLVIGLVFGAVRSVPLLLTARLRTAPALYRATQRVTAAEPLANRITVAAQAGVALTAAATAGLLL